MVPFPKYNFIVESFGGYISLITVAGDCANGQRSKFDDETKEETTISCDWAVTLIKALTVLSEMVKWTLAEPIPFFLEFLGV